MIKYSSIDQTNSITNTSLISCSVDKSLVAFANGIISRQVMYTPQTH